MMDRMPNIVYRLWTWFEEPVVMARAWALFGFLFCIQAAITVIQSVVGIWV